MVDRGNGRQPVAGRAAVMPLGLDAAARERVLAAGSFEVVLAGDRSLIGLVDRLFSRIEEAEAANRRLRAGLDRARLAALVATALAVALVAGVLAACLAMGRLSGLDGPLR